MDSRSGGLFFVISQVGWCAQVYMLKDVNCLLQESWSSVSDPAVEVCSGARESVNIDAKDKFQYTNWWLEQKLFNKTVLTGNYSVFIGKKSAIIELFEVERECLMLSMIRHAVLPLLHTSRNKRWKIKGKRCTIENIISTQNRTICSLITSCILYGSKWQFDMLNIYVRC